MSDSQPAGTPAAPAAAVDQAGIDVAEDARLTMRVLFWIGVATTFVGGLIAAIAKPGLEVDDSGGFDAGMVETGSSGGYHFGLVVAGLGSTFLWVALTAWAVSLGIRSTRDSWPTGR